MERCVSCLMPKTENIPFSGGQCHLCLQSLDAKQETGPGLDELAIKMDDIRRSGREGIFDCVVGLSGGRDSTYLLHQLVIKHKLRCLAAYHRTPFTPVAIDANVRRATQRLGVPLVEMDISMERHKKVARAFVLIWLKNPQPVIANAACAVCKQHNREIMRVATKYVAPYVVMGSNVYEKFMFSTADSDVAGREAFSFSQKTRQLAMLIRKGSRALMQTVELWRFIPLGVEAALCLTPEAPYLRLRYGRKKILNYFYYANWDETECKNALDETGWELPRHCRSAWRADCVFAEVKNQMFRKMTGVSYADAYFSNLVRAGVLSRAEGLRRLQSEGGFSRDRLAEACRILDLPAELLE